ncbi:MAG: ammonium transporter [Corynebacterium glucuronolyticum]|nr:ammonium transporter [Corynebacterium glucuronolyticum]
MTDEATLVVSGDSAWILISASLVLLMTPAVAIFYGGMSTRRNVLNMMMMSFSAMGVVSVVYVLWGWSMSYGTQSLMGIMANPFQHFGLYGSVVDDSGNYVEGASGYPNIIDIGFQLTFAVLSVAIISGALAGRVKFATWLIFAAVWSTIVYFPLAHMVWGGGLLSHSEHGVAAAFFGVTDGEATIAPIDLAGGTVVHISAGTAALVLAMITGKRMGFPHSTGKPHNLPMVMLGAALLWFGWCGFNGGSAFAADGLAGLAWVNTTVAAAAAMLGWLAVERIRDKHATSLGAASGLVAGLVTITPGAGVLMPVSSIALGFIGGILACLGVGMKFRFGYDDSLDVVGVHLVAAFWGTVGLAFFAHKKGLFTGGGWNGAKLFIVQAVVAIIAMIFTATLTALIAYLLKWSMGWRIDREEEYGGIDVAQHAEVAYDVAGPELRSKSFFNN